MQVSWERRRISGKTCQVYLVTLPTVQTRPLLYLLLYLVSLINAIQNWVQAWNWPHALPEHKPIPFSFSSSTVSNKGLFQLAQCLTTINFGRREWRPYNSSTNCNIITWKKKAPAFSDYTYTHKLCMILQVFLI